MDVPGPIAASARLYRRLLGFYPSAHQAEYGPPMSQLFEDQLRAAWRPQASELAWVVVSKADRISLALMALAVLLMLAMGMYFVGENLPCILGRQPTC